MLKKAQQFVLSPYMELYNILISPDHILRKFNDIVSFEFVYEDLKQMYCDNLGAIAIDPVMMFKLLLLKVMYPMSDRDLIARATTDLSFKYFLDLAPEDTLIHPSSLTKFRKLRLKDSALLDKLIQKTVEIAIEKELIKTKQIIVDSTHTTSIFKNMSPVDILKEESKKLRKAVYEYSEVYVQKMPPKPKTNDLEEHLYYCKGLVELLKKDDKLQLREDVKLKTNMLEEIVNDDIENLKQSTEPDAAVGHKSADTSFFGYKTHISMSPERIITAAIVTPGNESDGKYTQELIEKTIDNGYEVDTLIGDGAYSSKADLEYGKEHNIKIVSKLSANVYKGNSLLSKCNGFTYNKDAKMYVCTAGHMAIKKVYNGGKKIKGDKTTYQTYFFDVSKCQHCPHKNGCYKNGSKTKSFTDRTPANIQNEQIEFQNSTEFKELYSKRYMIEAKNSELKLNHGLKKCSQSGLFGMELQATTTIFVVNLKRIITLLNE